MAMYSLVECEDIYSKTSESLQEYYGDKPALNNANTIIYFPAANYNSFSFKFEENITGQTGNNGAKDIEIMLKLKYLSNFWATIVMTLFILKLFLF